MNRVRAVLFDRDDTLVHNDPLYNGDPDLVRPIAGARDAVLTAARHGLVVGVVSNQSGIGRGLLTPQQVDAVNARVDALVGPFGTWRYCPHAPDDVCACRKPQPGLVLEAARDLGVAPEEVAVVGDIESDVLAGEAAGGIGVLVPTAHTRVDEVRRARYVAPDLGTAVDLLVSRS